MDDNVSVKVLESYIEVEKFNQKINDKLFSFITRCSDLEELSNHNYSIQKSLELNKNYFQGYVLESYLCNYLKDNSNKDYSISELKAFMNQYANNSDEDYAPYYLALELYEMADEIEELIDKKIEYEMTLLYEYDEDIEKLETSKNYEELYNSIKNKLTDELLNKNLIDDTGFSKLMLMLNEVFNFFMIGYPDLTDEYINN